MDILLVDSGPEAGGPQSEKEVMKQAIRVFKARSKDCMVNDALEVAVRSLIAYSRQDDDVAFYSCAEIARLFGASPRTVSAVWRKLQREGLLRSTRGRGTVISGASKDRSRKVRSIIGLPVSEAGFLVLQEYREFYKALRDKLRHHGYAPCLALYSDDDSARPDFAARLQTNDVDVVIWIYPHRAVAHTVSLLLDAGIRLVPIYGQHELQDLPGYRVSRTAALKAAVQDWSHAGLKRCVVAASSRSPEECGWYWHIRRCLEQVGIEQIWRTGAATAESMDLDELSSHGTGLFLADAVVAGLLCQRATQQFFEICSQRRVLLSQGGVSAPLNQPPPDLEVDIVSLDVAKLAHRIAFDLMENRSPGEIGRTKFSANYRRRVKLQEFFGRSELFLGL